VRWAKPRIFRDESQAPNTEALEEIPPKEVEFGKAGIRRQ